MIDAVILAGGRGTRLKGVWDGPKCLVPVYGVPLLSLIFAELSVLPIRRIVLALGHKALTVVNWCSENHPLRELWFVIEAEQNGTAEALRRTLSIAKPPLLVMNGDTLPCCDLVELVTRHGRHSYNTSVITRTEHRYAGTAMLGGSILKKIRTSKKTNLEDYLLGGRKFFAEKLFIDIGTPETFHSVQIHDPN